MTPRPGPERKLTSSALQRIARASRVAAMRISLPRDPRHADDLGAVGRSRVAPAGPRAWLDERLEAEAHRVAVARDRNGVDRRLVAFLLRGDRADHARVQAERRDDLLAVLQLEEALDRLAVACRRRDVDEPRGIGNAEIAEEHRRRARAAGQHGQHRVALAHARRGHVLDLLLPLDPAVARHDDDVVLFDDEVLGGVLGLAGVRRDRRAARVAVLLLDLLDLDLDDAPAAGLVLEQRVDLARPAPLVLELLADDQDLEPRQPVDLQLEDGVGLLRVELEALDDLLRRVGLALRLADDLQDLVERIEDLLEALEDVDALLDRLQLVLEPLGDDLEPEVQEVPQDRVQVEPLRAGRSRDSRSG